MKNRSRALVVLPIAGCLLIACVTERERDGQRDGHSVAALSFSGGDNQGYLGTSLQDKQLALTLDDGPGSRTLELSAWLRDRGIQATFFVNGMHYGDDAASMIQQVLADGHLIGNHTQDHEDLTSLSNADILSQVEQTDDLLAPYVPKFLFRAPYGSWDSNDYAVLQKSPMKKYVGPVKWDIGGEMTSSYAADWDCWQNDDGYGVMTTKQCGDRYLAEIHDRGRGIILCHDQDYGDSSNHSLTSGQGNSVDMLEYVIPILQSEGYTFVRVDNVPDIAKAFGGTTDAGAPPDAGSGGSCAFDPTWMQTSYANDWWIEYEISGDVTAASFEVVGGATTTLTQSYGKWVGGPPDEVPSGTLVRVHATDSAGDTAVTGAFSYLAVPNPTTVCDSSPRDAGTTNDAGACFAPTFSEGDGANTWWVEYDISGSIASAYLEVPGKGTVTLAADEWGKWVGGPDWEIPAGTAVLVHATNTAGAKAQTNGFAYLDVTNPPAATCP